MIDYKMAGKKAIEVIFDNKTGLFLNYNFT